MVKKVFISHSNVICYFSMIGYLLANGGYLLLVYPLMIYGYALLSQTRPGKWFWYTTLYYTQVLIILLFFAQLDIWVILKVLDEDNEQNYVTDLLIDLNLGVFRI